MAQNPGKFKISKVLFFLEFGRSCTQSDHSAHSVLDVPTTLQHARKVKWLPSGNAGIHSAQNPLSILKISAHYPKTLIVLMFVALCLVYMYETRNHTMWEEHRFCGCLKTRCRKEYFRQEEARVGRKYIMRSLISLVIYNTLLG